MPTFLIDASIDKTGVNVGLSAAASTTYIVEQNVHIAADSFGYAALSTGATLVNFGGIFSNNTAAANLGGSNDHLVNEAGGSIAGEHGVWMNGANDTVTNLGTVAALDDGIFEMGNYGTIDNRGYLHGGAFGIEEEASITGAAITNSGTIEGGLVGILVGNAGFETSIINTGTISGNTQAIQIDVGQLWMTNGGKVLGNVQCFAGQADYITNSGAITGTVFLGKGNDTFDGTGGTSGEVVGGDGNDSIIGGNGADRLFGGNGNDTLTGGPGADHFIFSAALDAATNVDRITDFKHGTDKLDLDHAFFAAVGTAGTTLAAAAFYRGAHAHDVSDRIIYNPSNGFVYYDSNGSGAGHEVHFATLAHNLALTHADFLIT
jgi:Ca2+-binding RTX toxin-like protein